MMNHINDLDLKMLNYTKKVKFCSLFIQDKRSEQTNIFFRIHLATYLSKLYNNRKVADTSMFLSVNYSAENILNNGHFIDLLNCQRRKWTN